MEDGSLKIARDWSIGSVAEVSCRVAALRFISDGLNILRAVTCHTHREDRQTGAPVSGNHSMQVCRGYS